MQDANVEMCVECGIKNGGGAGSIWNLSGLSAQNFQISKSAFKSGIYLKKKRAGGVAHW